MKIKDRLSLYFSLICSGVLLLVMASIYFAFKKSMEADFYSRLKERALIAGNLYLEADEVSLDVLSRIREKLLQKIPGEVYRIYNSRNEGVFVPDSQQYWSSVIINKVREKGYLQYKEGRRQVAGILYHDNQGTFVIMASAVDDGTYKRLSLLIRIMSVTFVAVMLICFYSGRFLSERLLSPIDSLIEKIQLIRASNLHTRLETGTRKDEISILAANFNDLLQRLENSFTQQGTFVANVSHELRTPVTSIIGEVEVALKQKRSEEEYQRILQSVLSDSVRLKEMITAFLELTQIDSDFSRATLQPVRIDELLWELRDYWNNAIASDSLEIIPGNMPEDDSSLAIYSNKQLLYIAFNNVIANAFKFSGGQCVSCFLTVEGGFIMVKISDKGPGIRQEEFLKIFDPFYRSESVVEFAGSGVGLYITNKIISSFKGNLYVEESSASGTTLMICLPYNV